MKFSKSILFASALASAEASVLPRQHQNLAYVDYGELRIAVTASYGSVYDDRGTGANRDIAIWHPHHSEGFRALGSIAENAYGDRVNNKRATVLVAMNPNHPPTDPLKPALKGPDGWTPLYNDRGSGGDMDGSFWRPNCPGGYVSLGDVGSHNYAEPTYLVWCLRQDLARPGNFAAHTFWDDSGSGANQDAYLWEINPASNGPDGSESIPLYAGTFRVVNTRDAPNVPAWVLSIKVPKHFAKFSANVPKVTRDTIPSKGDLYNEIKQAEVVLPLTAYLHPKSGVIMNNLANPFAKITRSIAWIVEGVWQNAASGTVTRSDEVQYGFSKEKTQTLEHSAGVSVTASGGFKLVSFEVSMNYQFTSTSSTTNSEFSNYARKEEFTVPAHYAKVMFCKRIRVSIATVGGTVLKYEDNLASGEFHLAGTKLKK